MPTIRDVVIPAALVAEYEDARRCYEHAEPQSSSSYAALQVATDRYMCAGDAGAAAYARMVEPFHRAHMETSAATHRAFMRMIDAERAIANVVAAACGFPPPSKEP